MRTVEFITALFCEVDDHLAGIPKHPEAHLWPSEVVTLGLLHALKGVGNRAFYRWLTKDHRALFPHLPERTRLFRLFKTHQDWTQVFLAAPTVLGVIDTYGIELIHPMREGRSPQQIGRKGLSNHRWIVGGTLCLLLNQWGLVVGWACATANVADNTFQWLVRQVEDQMIVLSDTAFHAAEGDPTNLKLCQRGEWEERMLVETVLSMLTLVCHFKKVMHRGWAYFQARLAFTMAAFNVLVQWYSNNSPPPLIVTMTPLGYMAPRSKGTWYFPEVYGMIAKAVQCLSMRFNSLPYRHLYPSKPAELVYPFSPGLGS